jgi:hypothetical protein
MRRNKIPRLALANSLYRGVLPAQFEDLTWVEETVLHGNTCAHDMNIISTASVLSRTPADINGMLSIVFVGAGKFQTAKDVQDSETEGVGFFAVAEESQSPLPHYTS